MQSAIECEASVTNGNIRVAILKADIANLPHEVDVIVTTATDRLDHSKAAASKAIAIKAGQAVKREIHNQRRRLPLPEGELIVTSGGNLACKQLYHVTLKPRKKDHAKIIKALIRRCLEEANLSSGKSIAFPALGTGNLNYPKRDVALAMFESVEEYSVANPNSSVGFVFFVIFHTNTEVLTEFRAICKEQVDAQTRPFIDDLASLQKGGACFDEKGNNFEKLRSGNKIVEVQKVTLVDDNASFQVGGRSATAKANLNQDSNHDLCDEKWFFGNISRKEAEEKLSAHPDGVYLVRESESAPGCYAISVREDDGRKPLTPCVKHYKIERNENDVFFIARERPFKSLQELIKDCKESGVHRKTLVAPCPRTLEQEVYGTWEINEDGDSASGKPETAFRTLPHKPIRHISEQSTYSRASIDEPPQRMTPEFCSSMYQADIRPPPYWTKFTSEKSVKEWNISGKGRDRFVLVQVDEETYQYIEGIVQDTWLTDLHGHGRDAEGLYDLGYNRISINDIQRVENLTLYEQYASRRQLMFYESGKAGIYPDLRNAPGLKGGSTHIKDLLNDEWTKRLYSEVNEEYLLHGTKPENVESVYTQGLDPRLSRKAALGPAVYMAESSTKADQYTDSIDDRQQTGLTMFLVRACLGNICGVTQCRNMRRPPCTDSLCSLDDCQHVDRYDSVVAEEQFIFREFVVYDRTQVYPEYVISYDREIITSEFK